MINDIPDSFASKEALKGHILKPAADMLVEAEKKIGDLERQIRNGTAENEKLKWQCAQLRIGVAALAEHAGHTPEKVKEIFDAYCKEQEAEYNKMAEEAKKKFMQDMKDGKLPDLRVVDGGKAE